MEENVQNKISYEELEKLATELYAKLREANISNLFKRLDYLFKVVEFKDSFSKTFIESVVSEIETIMTLKDEREE